MISQIVYLYNKNKVQKIDNTMVEITKKQKKKKEG